MAEHKGVLYDIKKKIDHIALNMEKFKFVDYVYYIEHPKKMLFANFLSGIARGFGIAIGFLLLGAAAIYFLQLAVKWNLPVIGNFIAEIVKIVQQNLEKTGGNVYG
ncbi:MAG: DUF5665 domain-containing protein [Bacillota bacterium]|nr:DUF5665 domain-containing protein [Bacillota bacterium]